MRWLLPLAVVLSSCRNACQDICYEMRDYAENECDLVVPDGDLDACLAGEADDNSADDRRACRQNNSQRAIAEQWGCEELEDYFEAR